LERARLVLAETRHESVSLSDVAKRFLESAREPLLDVVDLLVDPTETLLNIRRTAEHHHPLSRAEWTVVAHFVQHGVEASSRTAPMPVSRESIVALLEAFLAVYALRTTRTSTWDGSYLEHLPTDCRPSPTTRSRRSPPLSDIVRHTVVETMRRLTDVATPMTVGATRLAGRNLRVLLEEERLAGGDALNRALRPFWSVLWRLAARGHYVVTRTPVRDPIHAHEARGAAAVPTITHDGVALSCVLDREMTWALSLPGLRELRYPIVGYPAIAEFRAMVAALQPHGAPPLWSGATYYGEVANLDPSRAVVWFGAHDNGITCACSAEEWAAVQTVVRRACDQPAVHAAIARLTLEYGEL
jgi:hypothetical protein